MQHGQKSPNDATALNLGPLTLRAREAFLFSPMNRAAAAFGLAVLVVVASVALYSSSNLASTSVYPSGSQTSSQSSTSSVVIGEAYVRGNFSSSANSVDGLRLVLSSDASTIPLYGKLLVRVEEASTSNQPLNVTAAHNWTVSVVADVGCGSPDMVGIALFAGNLSQGELQRGKQLSDTGRGICTMPPQGLPNAYSYKFMPSSSSATGAYGCEANSVGNGMGTVPCGCEIEVCPPYLSVRPAETVAYFSIDSQFGFFHYLSPGVYTLVGADEWGAVAILHFEVANPGCPFPQSSGSTGLPFANQQTAVNGSWSFHVGLNSTFVLRNQGVEVSASLETSNYSIIYQHPSLLYASPFLASLQLLSPNGTVVWTYPPHAPSLIDVNGSWPLDQLDMTNQTIGQLQGNQTYTLVAKPLLFVQQGEPYSVGLTISLSLTVC